MKGLAATEAGTVQHRSRPGNHRVASSTHVQAPHRLEFASFALTNDLGDLGTIILLEA